MNILDSLFCLFILSVTFYTGILLLNPLMEILFKLNRMCKVPIKIKWYKYIFILSSTLFLILFPMNMLLYHFDVIDLKLSITLTCYFVVSTIISKYTYDEIRFLK